MQTAPVQKFALSTRWMAYHLADRKALFRFDQLTTIQPKEKLNLECKDGRMTTRVLDLFAQVARDEAA